MMATHKSCRQHTDHVGDTQTMLMPCRVGLVIYVGKKTTNSITILCVAVVLGDGGGVMAFGEVCWAAIEGSGGAGLWRQ